MLLGQGGQQLLGGRDRTFLWSQGGIQAQAAFLSESDGVGGGPWLLASHEDPQIWCSNGLALLPGFLPLIPALPSVHTTSGS